MNRLITLGVLVIIVVACNSQPKSEQAKIEAIKTETASTLPCGITGAAMCAGCPQAAKETGTMIVSVDSVQKNPEKYFDKTIVLQGRVVHTCKVTGKKMFVAGSDEQNLIRINAGENISKFDESLQGEIVKAKGVLTPLTDNVSDIEKSGKTVCVTESKAKQYVLDCSEFEVVAKD